jgi:hypothetical protein
MLILLKIIYYAIIKNAIAWNISPGPTMCPMIQTVKILTPSSKNAKREQRNVGASNISGIFSLNFSIINSTNPPVIVLIISAN